MNCFNHADDFMRFLTEAHVVYRAMEITGMDDVDSEPSQQFSSAPDKSQAVLDVAEQIVNEAWLLPAMSSVKAVADCVVDDNQHETWCICGEGSTSTPDSICQDV